MLLESLDASLENSPLAADEYFNLLTQLLTENFEKKEAPKELKLGGIANHFAIMAGSKLDGENKKKKN